MKKLITFLAGIFLIALTLGMLFLTSAIYDSVKKTSVDTYFFQTNLRSEMRPGEPMPVSEIGETAMREMMIKKYISEYFYAIPDVENIARRMTTGSALSRMSTKNVFDAWVNGEASEIQTLAINKKMRIADIDGEIFKPEGSDYWVVPYVLYTWESANDMNVAPTVTHGTLLMGLFYAPGTRRTIDVGNHLKHSYNRFEIESKYDPAIIFRFAVTHLEPLTDD